MRFWRNLCIVLAVLAAASTAGGATLYVDDDAPGDPAGGDPSISDPSEDGSLEHPYDAIQEAIVAATHGDEIVVFDGTYTGAGNRDISFLGKAVHLQSLDGPDNCVIDCERQGGAFRFDSGEGSLSILEGFTITGVYTSGSVYGAIRCEGSSPTITGNVIFGNWHLAIDCSAASPTITNNIISDNDWGIQLVVSGTAVISNNAIIRCIYDGVGCYDDSDALITNCILWDNDDDLVRCTATYSCTQRKGPGTGNISSDPLFEDPEYGDFHLPPESPCIDAGADTSGAAFGSVLVGLDGHIRGADGSPEARGDGSDYDIGPYEWYPTADAGADPVAYESRGPEAYVVHLDGTASVGVQTFQWTQLSGVAVALRAADTLTPDFDAPQWDGSTELTRTEATLLFDLSINDGAFADTVEVYVRIPGDVDGDDKLNAFDISLIRKLDPASDFDGNNLINAFDIIIYRINFGRKRTVD